MADEAEQVQVIQQVRRSRRQNGNGAGAAAGEAYVASQRQLEEIDHIISGIVNAPGGQPTVTLGDSGAQSVRTISSEQLVRSYRQQSGE